MNEKIMNEKTMNEGLERKFFKRTKDDETFFEDSEERTPLNSNPDPKSDLDLKKLEIIAENRNGNRVPLKSKKTVIDQTQDEQTNLDDESPNVKLIKSFFRLPKFDQFCIIIDLPAYMIFWLTC